MKRIISLVTVIVLMLLCLVSCFVGNKDKGDKKDENTTLIYGEGVKTSIVLSAGGDSFDTSAISNAIFDACGVVVGLKNDGVEKDSSEIVVGETSREITAAAKEAMNKALRSAIINSPDEETAEKDLVAYCVYASEGSLAIVWSSQVIVEDAIDYLVSEYLDGATLDSDPAISDVQTVSLAEYYENMAEEHKTAEWAALRKGFIDFGCDDAQADECVAAVRKFYSMVDEKMYTWLANLYDPDEGGFYYSNSGRDTAGFAPDIESTFQALNMLNATGLVRDFGSDTGERLRNALPEEMKAKIVNFVKVRQSDKDGYFHHPQWEGMDSEWTARLGRDLSWAKGILTWFEEEPLYKYANERGTSPASGLTGRLGSSTVASVSKTVMASSVPDRFTSPEKYRAYLESFDWAKSSYQAGHTAGTDSGFIRSQGLIEVYRDFIYEKQNPENGLWEDGVYYASVNGLMKILASFQSLGIKLNYADKAFESAMTMAKHTGADDEGLVANHIVDVYNPWYTMSDILLNIEKHGTLEEVAAIRATLIEEAPSLIEGSMQKTVPFKKDDGSFGYNWDYSPAASQGAPVAVPGSREGDVNGCTMAVNGVIGNMLEVFGVSMPRRYYINDYFKFMDIIENVGSVIKSNVGTEALVESFDGELVGSTEPSFFTNELNGIGQVELREGSDEDKCFHIQDTSSSQGTSVRFSPGGVPTGASRCVLSLDINVKNADGIFYQFFMGSTYQLILTADGKNVRIGDSSTKGVNNDFGISFPMGEWHNIRVEYYYTGDAATTVTKIFLDNHLRALSDNYYGKLPGKEGTPPMNYADVHLYTLYEPIVDVYIDNLYANKDNEIYVEEATTNPNLVTDFEGLEAGKFPGGFTPKSYEDNAVIEIVDNPFADKDSGASGKVLHWISPTGSSQITRNIESNVSRGNAFVFESDIYFAKASESGAITQTYFRAADGKIFALTFAGGRDSDGAYVDLCTLNISNNTAGDALARIYLGKWVNLRIEYYRYQYVVSSDGNLWDGVKVRVLLDGEEVFNGLCDYPDPNALSKDGSAFFSYILSGKTLETYMDNIKFELANIPYVDENGQTVPDPENPAFPRGSAPILTPAGKDHDGKFDFEDVKPGEVIVEGIETRPNEAEYGNVFEIAKDPNGDDALKILTVPSTKRGNTVIFESSKKSPQNADCHIFEFTVNVKKAAGDENYLQLYMTTSGGSVASYNILFAKGVNGEVKVSQNKSSTQTSTQSPISGVFNYSGGDVTLRFEYYESNGMTKLYVNNVYLTEGYGCFNEKYRSSEITHVRIDTLIKSNFEIYFDDVSSYSVQKAYVCGQ